MKLRVSNLHKQLNFVAAFTVVVAAIMFEGCSKTKPSQPTIEQHCHAKILETLKSRPLSRIEKSFFKDGKSRGILKAEQLSPLAFAEGRSSATAANFIQEFSFINKTGQTIKLIRNENNGGINVAGGNIVTPRIQCTVTWGLFKGKVMKDQLKVIMVKLDKLQRKMRELDTIVEGSW